jgi:hypothetical protein
LKSCKNGNLCNTRLGASLSSPCIIYCWEQVPTFFQVARQEMINCACSASSANS